MDPVRETKAIGHLASAVEEKFGEQNFRVLSEMRILAKIQVVILDLVGYVYFLAKFDAKSDRGEGN